MSGKENRMVELFGELNDELVQEAQTVWEEAAQGGSVGSGAKKRIAGGVLARIKSSGAGSTLAKAACAALVLGSFCMIQPKVRAAVSEAIVSIRQILGFGEEIAPYTEEIGQSQTKEGITVTLGEAILTDDRLIVSYAVAYEDEKRTGELPYFGVGTPVKYDGRTIMPTSSRLVPETNPDSEWEETGRYVYTEYYRKGIIPKETEKVEWTLQVYGETADRDHPVTAEEALALTDGTPFTFEFCPRREAEPMEAWHVALEERRADDRGNELTVKRFEISPVGSRISAKYNAAYKSRNFDGLEYAGVPAEEFYWIGRDSLGNTVWYSSCGGNDVSGYWEAMTEDYEGILEEECHMLSPESEWVELQLYRADIVLYEETDLGLLEKVTQEETDGEEIAAETGDIYGFDFDNAVAVGDPVRIDLKAAEQD